MMKSLQLVFLEHLNCFKTRIEANIFIMIEIGIERISPGRVKNVRGDRKKIEREKNEGRTEKARTGKSGDLRIIREEEGEGKGERERAT